MTKRCSIREWGELRIASAGDEIGAVTRNEADQLLRIAGHASEQLGLGGEDGARILSEGRSRLRAGQVVGLLAARDVSLEILPKIDGADDGRTRENLIRMLSVAIDLPISGGAIANLGVQRFDLIEILIRLFCERLFEAVHRGLPRRYVECSDDLPLLRGRLNVIRQFTAHAGAPQKLACHYEELSPDVPLNKIMKAAITKLRGLARAPDNQRLLSELAIAFAEVLDVEINQLRWDQVVLDRTNRVWADLLKLARLLLGKRFQTTSAGAYVGFSLLFEMNTLFEEFIGRVMRRALQADGYRISLQSMKGHALIDGDGKGRFATIPDIFVHTRDQDEWIIDTKWKRLKGHIDDPRHGVSQADVYQMMAYSQIHRCRRLMLLYPHHADIGREPGRIGEYVVSGTDDTRLVIATVDLSDLRTVPAQLIRLIRSDSGVSIMAVA